ncbi:hypothetical protein KKA15_06750 [Patescibacteria group bacterium]|nr:hypothetical protein [Patescibacteria group bacterium]
MGTWDYIIILAIIIFFILALKFLKVKNLKFFNWVEVEFLPSLQKKYYISTKDKIGIVVSQDNKMYKIQVHFSIKCEEETSINNAQLYISGLGWFVFRHYIQQIGNSMIPLDNNTNLTANVIHERAIEFEPKEGWEPFELKIKKYKSLLKVHLVDKTIKHKFTFQVRNQNIEAIKNLTDKQDRIPRAQIFYMPIVKN